MGQQSVGNGGEINRGGREGLVGRKGGGRYVDGVASGVGDSVDLVQGLHQRQVAAATSENKLNKTTQIFGTIGRKLTRLAEMVTAQAWRGYDACNAIADLRAKRVRLEMA